MSNDRLEQPTQSQCERFIFVELNACFIREVRHQDLVTWFDTQSAAATRNLIPYKEIAHYNINYDAKGKAYMFGDDIRTAFDFPPMQRLPQVIESRHFSPPVEGVYE